MSIYSFYENTYKKINNNILVSKFLNDDEIKEIISLSNICKAIDENMVILSLAGKYVPYAEQARGDVYDRFRRCLNNYIFNNEAFKSELKEQLNNYNITVSNDIDLLVNLGSKEPFSLNILSHDIAKYASTELYNILDTPVLKITEAFYKKIYKNKVISEVFDNFKDMTNANVKLIDDMCIIYPNINNKDIRISIEYNKVFKKEE